MSEVVNDCPVAFRELVNAPLLYKRIYSPRASNPQTKEVELYRELLRGDTEDALCYTDIKLDGYDKIKDIVKTDLNDPDIGFHFKLSKLFYEKYKDDDNYDMNMIIALIMCDHLNGIHYAKTGTIKAIGQYCSREDIVLPYQDNHRVPYATRNFLKQFKDIFSDRGHHNLYLYYSPHFYKSYQHFTGNLYNLKNKVFHNAYCIANNMNDNFTELLEDNSDGDIDDIFYEINKNELWGLSVGQVREHLLKCQSFSTHELNEEDEEYPEYKPFLTLTERYEDIILGVRYYCGKQAVFSQLYNAETTNKILAREFNDKPIKQGLINHIEILQKYQDLYMKAINIISDSFLYLILYFINYYYICEDQDPDDIDLEWILFNEVKQQDDGKYYPVRGSRGAIEIFKDMFMGLNSLFNDNIFTDYKDFYESDMTTFQYELYLEEQRERLADMKKDDKKMNEKIRLSHLRNSYTEIIKNLLNIDRYNEKRAEVEWFIKLKKLNLDFMEDLCWEYPKNTDIGGFLPDHYFNNDFRDTKLYIPFNFSPFMENSFFHSGYKVPEILDGIKRNVENYNFTYKHIQHILKFRKINIAIINSGSNKIKKLIKRRLLRINLINNIENIRPLLNKRKKEIYFKKCRWLLSIKRYLGDGLECGVCYDPYIGRAIKICGSCRGVVCQSCYDRLNGGYRFNAVKCPYCNTEGF
jgi:hypothetical protein